MRLFMSGKLNRRLASRVPYRVTGTAPGFRTGVRFVVTYACFESDAALDGLPCAETTTIELLAVVLTRWRADSRNRTVEFRRPSRFMLPTYRVKSLRKNSSDFLNPSSVNTTDFALLMGLVMYPLP